MKIHKPLAQAIVSNLSLIFKENRQADKVVEYTLKQYKKWGARDRSFVAENTYDMVRWWRLLQFCINAENQKPETNGWQMLGAWLLLSGYDLPQWTEFEGLDKQDIVNKRQQAEAIRAVRESIPDWLDACGLAEVADWDNELAALNRPASLYIRANTLKISRENLMEALTAEGLEVEPVAAVKSAIHILGRKKLNSLSAFRKGMFEVQDVGSQLIANFLEAQSGMQVIDACAGAGGKTLALATEMKNEGGILAFDVHVKKLEELKRRAEKNGIRIVKAQKINLQLIRDHQGFADRVLLDVPCSGLGVLKRKPDTKWKLKPEFLAEIKEIQSEIFRNYSAMLRPGGKLVYATCSLLRSENQDQVAKFLNEHSDFQLEDEQFVSPSSTGFDGFYMARLLRRP